MVDLSYVKRDTNNLMSLINNISILKKAGDILKEITISSEFIKLDQFLKWAEIASTGGESKALIIDGKIKVNNAVEFARGKKLHDGDIIEVLGNQYKIVRE
jgi:ribosome-associated protein